MGTSETTQNEKKLWMKFEWWKEKETKIQKKMYRSTATFKIIHHQTKLLQNNYNTQLIFPFTAVAIRLSWFEDSKKY